MALTKVDKSLLETTSGTPSASTFLRGDGTWNAPASGGFIKYTVVVASIDPFALQSNTTKLVIEVQASGGTAGTGASGYNGGSGGAGAYARKFLSPMVGTDTLDINIGAVPALGVAGNTTSVASASGTAFTTISCVGGAGGTSAYGSTQGTGGAGGTLPTTGDFNLPGGDGMSGGPGASNAPGGSFYSINDQRTTMSAGVGKDALGYGGGGGAPYGASGVGGAGGPAVVIVWEYA